jgi:hypothetical protein
LEFAGCDGILIISGELAEFVKFITISVEFADFACIPCVVHGICTFILNFVIFVEFAEFE